VNPTDLLHLVHFQVRAVLVRAQLRQRQPVYLESVKELVKVQEQESSPAVPSPPLHEEECQERSLPEGQLFR